jgi:cysteinyl-tRNA synthetase
MAMSYLGETIDLHAGGEDLIFPHHECEIAQSEALTGKPFCHHWVHTRFLQVNGQKMSKSLGNFYTVRDLLERGADPFAIRYALIGGMYSKQYNFTDQALSDAMGNVERLRRADAAAKAGVEAARNGADTLREALEAIYDEALEAMLNDLNTPVALAKALEGARVITREADTLSGASAASAQTFVDRINALLGIVKYDRELPCGDSEEKPKASGVDEAWIEAKITERAEAKKAKDFARSDAIRNELAEKGIELRDTPNGVEWVLKSGLRS